MGNITALYCGAFKPLTGAHIRLIDKYLQNENIKKLVLFISPGKRDFIDADDALIIAKRILQNKPVEIIVDTKSYSPILAVYRWIENPERTPGNYTLISSTKDNDNIRVNEFVKNYTLDKFKKNLPPKVNVIDFNIGDEPFKDNEGTIISASNVRTYIKENKYNEFKNCYLGLSEDNIEFIWNYLKTKI